MNTTKKINFFSYILFRLNKTDCLNLKHYFPVAFDDITYQNYQDKFHALLHMNELEVSTTSVILNMIFLENV